LRTFTGSDLPAANPLIRQVEDPYGGAPIYVVPPLHPDISIVHVQRADANGNAQIWGLLGMQAEVAFAADRVIVVAEEIVDEEVIRRDPNRTVIPSLVVDAVVHEPITTETAIFICCGISSRNAMTKFWPGWMSGYTGYPAEASMWKRWAPTYGKS
jgi:hypothetical protein